MSLSPVAGRSSVWPGRRAAAAACFGHQLITRLGARRRSNGLNCAFHLGGFRLRVSASEGEGRSRKEHKEGSQSYGASVPPASKVPGSLVSMS